jgi:hypothetical protein
LAPPGRGNASGDLRHHGLDRLDNNVRRGVLHHVADAFELDQARAADFTHKRARVDRD